MKNVFFAVVLLAAISLQAQQRPSDQTRKRLHKKEMADLAPEQRAELRTKRMVLNLNLTETQQKKVEKLNKYMTAKHEENQLSEEERAALTQEEHFARKNAFLDNEIAYRRELKQILTEEQYTKFEKLRHQKARDGKRKPNRNKG